MAVVLQLLAALWRPLAATLGLLWVRRDARKDARQETALEAAERYAKTRKDMDDAPLANDPDIARRWLSERDAASK